METPKLIGGPYNTPICRIGGTLPDLRHHRTEKTVRGITDAIIPWPYYRMNKGPSLILCGDLVIALNTESPLAISYYWGISLSFVVALKRAINAPKRTEGTKARWKELRPIKLTHELSLIGLEKSLAVRRAKAATHKTKSLLKQEKQS